MDNFKNNKTMKKYKDDDYRIKKYLHLITLGQRKKVWMPAPTRFDKRGGSKHPYLIAGLGQIPGLS